MNDEIIYLFPSSISQDRKAIDWAKKLTFENLRTAQEASEEDRRTGGGDASVTDSEMKHTLLEINKHLNNQRGVKERKDLGRKSIITVPVVWFE